MSGKDSKPLKGADLLMQSRVNRGTAFTKQQRRDYALEGLLPPQVESEETQLMRVHQQLDKCADNSARYLLLAQLKRSNRTLFFKLVMSDPAHFVPIVYAPTLADICQNFSHLYQFPRGMYIDLSMKGRIRDVLENWPQKEDVRFICVTTGGRILGLGDIGVNGMGIVIGKLDLYTACGQIPPDALLPIQLDIGTTNEALLKDPLYQGTRRHPPARDELNAFVDEFVDAARDVFKDCCIHFEDWKGEDALYYLARYKDRILCYNDDIQGTAAVTLAGLMSALKIKREKLSQQRFLLVGAGASGIGISDIFLSALRAEGLSEEESYQRITLMDKDGVLSTKRQDLSDVQRKYAKDLPLENDLNILLDIVKPTVLIGVSTKGGKFTSQIVQKMCTYSDRPVIFAMSLPQRNGECTAQQAYEWSEGKALFAAGLQYDPVTWNEHLFRPGQANNFYIFPGLALAVYATRPKRITDQIIIEAANSLAAQVGEDLLQKACLFPPQKDILKISFTSAVRITNYILQQTSEATTSMPEGKTTEAWLHSLLYNPNI